MRNRRNRASICFDCKKAVCGCSWSRTFEPVPGWEATPAELRSPNGTATKTWYVTYCPEFDPDDGYTPPKPLEPPKPKSNGDCIRTMSDKDLAEFLCSMCNETQEDKVIEWLRQPSE